ncbi:hypothetical protein T265_07130 [Opisthorchis viverrini]|uniref:Uncharacterized protein n=1 Tax=Opisthorchis viverrini TaxID=6198 RepID=A0A075ACH8_OPIVI|nr:hypothetical protein T265_07130 [Opisthorchis viverrini]KER25449.1 hypothetical protein T265_07130 [Opisthorchis viverrini]
MAANMSNLSGAMCLQAAENLLEDPGVLQVADTGDDAETTISMIKSLPSKLEEPNKGQMAANMSNLSGAMCLQAAENLLEDPEVLQVADTGDDAETTISMVKSLPRMQNLLASADEDQVLHLVNTLESGHDSERLPDQLLAEPPSNTVVSSNTVNLRAAAPKERNIRTLCRNRRAISPAESTTSSSSAASSLTLCARPVKHSVRSSEVKHDTRKINLLDDYVPVQYAVPIESQHKQETKVVPSERMARPTAQTFSDAESSFSSCLNQDGFTVMNPDQLFTLASALDRHHSSLANRQQALRQLVRLPINDVQACEAWAPHILEPEEPDSTTSWMESKGPPKGKTTQGNRSSSFFGIAGQRGIVRSSRSDKPRDNMECRPLKHPRAGSCLRQGLEDALNDEDGVLWSLALRYVCKGLETSPPNIREPFFLLTTHPTEIIVHCLEDLAQLPECCSDLFGDRHLSSGDKKDPSTLKKNPLDLLFAGLRALSVYHQGANTKIGPDELEYHKLQSQLRIIQRLVSHQAVRCLLQRSHCSQSDHEGGPLALLSRAITWLVEGLTNQVDPIHNSRETGTELPVRVIFMMVRILRDLTTLSSSEKLDEFDDYCGLVIRTHKLLLPEPRLMGRILTNLTSTQDGMQALMMVGIIKSLISDVWRAVETGEASHSSATHLKWDIPSCGSRVPTWSTDPIDRIAYKPFVRLVRATCSYAGVDALLNDASENQSTTYGRRFTPTSLKEFFQRTLFIPNDKNQSQSLYNFEETIVLALRLLSCMVSDLNVMLALECRFRLIDRLLKEQRDAVTSNESVHLDAVTIERNYLLVKCNVIGGPDERRIPPRSLCEHLSNPYPYPIITNELDEETAAPFDRLTGQQYPIASCAKSPCHAWYAHRYPSNSASTKLDEFSSLSFSVFNSNTLFPKPIDSKSVAEEWYRSCLDSLVSTASTEKLADSDFGDFLENLSKCYKLLRDEKTCNLQSLPECLTPETLNSVELIEQDVLGIKLTVRYGQRLGMLKHGKPWDVENSPHVTTLSNLLKQVQWGLQQGISKANVNRDVVGPSSKSADPKRGHKALCCRFGFDWFTATIFIGFRGDSGRCWEFLSQFASDPRSVYLWPVRGQYLTLRKLTRHFALPPDFFPLEQPMLLELPQLESNCGSLGHLSSKSTVLSYLLRGGRFSSPEQSDFSGHGGTSYGAAASTGTANYFPPGPSQYYATAGAHGPRESENSTLDKDTANKQNAPSETEVALPSSTPV